jgi:5-methylcytosine-specific restriction endonuclease McrA
MPEASENPCYDFLVKLSEMNDDELTSRFSDLLIEENERFVLHLEFLVELERRKLFYSYPSLWAYLVHEKKMDNTVAERHIRASKILVRFPWVKEKIESGRLNLSLLDMAQVVANREKLSDEDFSEVLHAVSGMSYKKARRAIAAMYPESLEILRDHIRPLTDELSEVRFAAPHELIEKLEEIRGLLAHSHPGASLAKLIDVLASEYRERHHPEEKAKRAEARKKEKEPTQKDQAPPTSRVPSQLMIHALVLRDGYRCSYRDPSTGRSCGSKHALQIDHVVSWARNGKTELENLRFLCANHHRRVSFLEFGEGSNYFRPR